MTRAILLDRQRAAKMALRIAERDATRYRRACETIEDALLRPCEICQESAGEGGALCPACAVSR